MEIKVGQVWELSTRLGGVPAGEYEVVDTYNTNEVLLRNTKTNISYEVTSFFFGDSYVSSVQNTVKEVTPENTKTGGSTPSQYRKSLNLPLTGDRGEFYTVDIETSDICDEWDFDQNQHNILKAMCRLGKKDGTSDEYDLNKILFYGLRLKMKHGKITHKQFWEQCVALGLSKEI